MVQNKVTPKYRRYDSQADCYRRPTIRELPTPKNPMRPTTVPTAMFPEEPIQPDSRQS